MSDRATVYPQFTIPYGILSMDSYIKKYSTVPITTDIIDFNLVLKNFLKKGLSKPETISNAELLNSIFMNELTKNIQRTRPQIVGISVLFNSSASYISSLVDIVKKANLDSVVILGGGMPSAAYKILLNKIENLDAICKGEGERPMLGLVSSSNKKEFLETHPAFITATSSKIGKIPTFDYVNNLDEIPMLDYSLVDLGDYNSRSIDKQYAHLKEKREMSIHTSRGCPFSCVFCSNPTLHGKDVRFMSLERVTAEITRMRDEFGMNVLMIEDDHFFHDKERAKEILRRVAQLGIRAEFPNGLAVYAIDEEVASLLSKAGVSAVALAVESGSDHVLNKIIKKPLKKKLIKPAVDRLRNVGVKSHVFIVTGLPGELDEHREETRNMLIDVGFDWVHVYCAIPIHGSRLYDICVENGYIEDSSSTNFVATKSVIRAPGVDPDVIARWAYETNLLVNFVKNSNLRLGKYEVARSYFQNVVDKYPKHFLGLLMLWFTNKQAGTVSRLNDELLTRAQEVLNEDEEWREFYHKFRTEFAQDISESLYSIK